MLGAGNAVRADVTACQVLFVDRSLGALFRGRRASRGKSLKFMLTATIARRPFGPHGIARSKRRKSYLVAETRDAAEFRGSPKHGMQQGLWVAETRDASRGS